MNTLIIMALVLFIGAIWIAVLYVLDSVEMVLESKARLTKIKKHYEALNARMSGVKTP